MKSIVYNTKVKREFVSYFYTKMGFGSVSYTNKSIWRKRGKKLQLEELRVKIDEIDQEIVRLIEARMEVCEQVGRYKIENKKRVFDKIREQEKLEKVAALAQQTQNKEVVKEVFEQLMTISRNVQHHLLMENGLAEQFPFQMLEQLADPQCKVVFQGVEGAYSQIALFQYFGTNVETIHVEQFADAIQAVQNQEADYAVLPIENSSAGVVTQIYHLLVDYETYIVGEVVVSIEHTIASVAGATVAGVEQVYSHTQALMQCCKYLEAHPQMEQISVANTAIAAQKVQQEQNPKKAAICSTVAAEVYGLQVLEEKINHEEKNATRFIVIGREKQFLRSAKKISIYFEVLHESGSLYKVLSHLIYNKLNMTKIESMPVEGKVWEYRFFVDFEGNLNDPTVTNALRGIQEEAVRLCILGNY